MKIPTFRQCRAFCVLIILPALSTSVRGDFLDTFESATISGGNAVSETTWTRYTTASTTLSIESDSTTGPDEGSPDNALQVAVGGQGFRGVFGILSSPTSLAVGDQLTLGYDFRFTGTGGIENNDSSIRFGLFNSNGTSSATDAFGYYARLGAGTSSAVDTVFESGTNGTVLGGSDGSTLSGTNSRSTNGSLINDSNSDRLELRLTRTAASEMLVEVFQNSSLIWTGSDTSATTFSYDMIALGTGTNKQDYRLDNVTMTFIPEPSTLFLVGGALSVLALFRRRK